jgi:hypothetical protein
VDRTVARLNIEYFQKMLETATDVARRRLIVRLPAEDEAKLTVLEERNERSRRWPERGGRSSRLPAGLVPRKTRRERCRPATAANAWAEP